MRELHIHTSEFVREDEQGGVIVIERRGEPVAELRPIADPERMPAGKKARIFDSMRYIWDRMPQVGDSTQHLATAHEAGEREVWTNDRRMLAAASYFGLTGRSAQPD